MKLVRLVKRMQRYIGEILLIVTAIIWGSGFVASAVSLEHYTPYQILAVRFLMGALLLSVLFFKKFKRLTKRSLLSGIVLGVFLYVAFALQTVGLQFTTPSKNAFLTAVNVVIVPFIGFLIYKRKIDMYELTGAILAIAGVAVLSLKLSAEINVGDLLTLGCAVAFAFHIFYTAIFVQKEDPVVLTIVQMGTSALIAWIIVFFRGETTFSVETEGVLYLLYLGVFSTTIAYLMQTVAQKYITETKAAIILSTESFWGMVFSVIILSEILTVKMLVGAILILLAIVISETKFNLLKKRRTSI